MDFTRLAPRKLNKDQWADICGSDEPDISFYDGLLGSKPLEIIRADYIDGRKVEHRQIGPNQRGMISNDHLHRISERYIAYVQENERRAKPWIDRLASFLLGVALTFTTIFLNNWLAY